MKHVFIINPAAGQENSEQPLLDALKQKENLDYEVYYTTGPHDATEHVKKLAEENPDKQFCFYACGGDGTINEVVNGVYGHSNSAMSVYPCGSGNDYVKYFGGADKFTNIDNLINGEEIMVDVMEVQGIYSLNVINFGFDTVVAKTIGSVKRKPIIGGKNSYTTGVIRGVLFGRSNEAEIKVDGEILNPNGKYLLCTLANGSHVGGSFNCAPRSVVDDGLIEVCMAKKMLLVNFISLIGKYQNGLHLDDEKCKKLMEYRQAKKIEVTCSKEMDLCIDGEIITGKHFEIINNPQAVKFIAPKA